MKCFSKKRNNCSTWIYGSEYFKYSSYQKVKTPSWFFHFIQNSILYIFLIFSPINIDSGLMISLKSLTMYQQLWSFLHLCKTLCHFKSFTSAKLIPQKSTMIFRKNILFSYGYTRTHAYWRHLDQNFYFLTYDCVS